MKNLNKELVLLCLLSLAIAYPVFSQFTKVGFGTHLLYNQQTEGTGFGLRIYIPINEMMVISSKLDVFPKANLIHEKNLAVGFQYHLINNGDWTFFPMAELTGNQWTNYQDFIFPKAQKNSIALEGGAGILRSKGIFRPTLEWKYNPFLKEATFRLGILAFIKPKQPIEDELE